MRRIATFLATTAVLLTAPAAAFADSVAVNGNKLSFNAGAGQVDTVHLSDGTGAQAGKHVVQDQTSPAFVLSGQCVALGADSAACSTAFSLFVNTYDQNDAVTIATALGARVDAGDGNDTATGGRGWDTLIGNAGNDTLTGAGGYDWVYGGEGDDLIDARDGGADWVDCGAGNDLASTDDNDTVIGCEGVPATAPEATKPVAVVQTPVTPVAPTTPVNTTKPAKPTTETALPVDLVGPVGLVETSVAVASNGSAALGLSCDEVETAGCAGVAYLDPVLVTRGKKTKLKKAKKVTGHASALRRGRYGKSSFVIAAGKSKKLQVKLSPEARRALGLAPGKKAKAARRGRRVKAVVTVIQRGRASARSIVELRS